MNNKRAPLLFAVSFFSYCASLHSMVFRGAMPRRMVSLCVRMMSTVKNSSSTYHDKMQDLYQLFKAHPLLISTKKDKVSFFSSNAPYRISKREFEKINDDAVKKTREIFKEDQEWVRYQKELARLQRELSEEMNIYEGLSLLKILQSKSATIHASVLREREMELMGDIVAYIIKHRKMWDQASNDF